MRTTMIGGLGVIVALAILASPFLIYRHAKYASEHSVTFTITKLPDRSIQYDSQGNKNTYANLVYTNKGTFENIDSTWPWKQNSSDLYAQLQQGHKYTCDVAGWRIGFFSAYPDLIRCKELK